jgi:hypothetical protein
MHRLLASLTALALLSVSAAAEAKPPLFRLWADVHGSVLAGQGQYFDAQNGPYVGGAGQLGLAILVFELYLDVNVFDTGRGQGEAAPTMWNQLGAGINVPISLGGKLELFGRLNGSLTFAPYELDDSNGGFVFRGGGGLEFKATSTVRLGAACYGGYHFFGSRANNDNGRHIMSQLYTRFEFGF